MERLGRALAFGNVGGRAEPLDDMLIGVTNFFRDHVARARAAGFSAHLGKPMSVERLNAVVRYLLPRKNEYPEVGSAWHGLVRGVEGSAFHASTSA